MPASDEASRPSTVRATPALPLSMLAGFVCAVGLLIGVGFLNAWNIQRVYGANAAVIHAHAVHTSLDQVLAALLDAETGQRGFIITGEPRYLEPYTDAADHIHARLEAAGQLIADDSEQTRDLILLTATAANSMNFKRRSGYAVTSALRQRNSAFRRTLANGRWTRFAPLSRAWNRERTGLWRREVQRHAAAMASLASGIASMFVAIACTRLPVRQRSTQCRRSVTSRC